MLNSTHGDDIYFLEVPTGRKLRSFETGSINKARLSPNGKFIITPIEAGTRFTEVMEVRFSSLVKLFATKRIQAMERHQEEEMINLKKVLENN